MRTYNQLHFSQISEILMQAALGMSAVLGYKYITSDMIHSSSDLNEKMYEWKEPYYIAIREQGTESGSKEHCLDRCKGLGYPIIIARIDKNKTFDYDMKIMLTHYWFNGDNNHMEREFNSL